MNNNKHTNFWQIPLVIVFIMWGVYWFEIKYGFNFTKYGVRPGKLFGLRGVFFGPFIHSGIEHLYNNSLPILVLGSALYYFYKNIFWKVFIYGTIALGLMTWIIGRESYHIGASGIVYMFASFLFFKGVVTRYYRLLALSLAVVFYYGSMIWYVFPLKEGVSWEGHLSGGVIGLLLAIIFDSQLNYEKEFKYEWQQPEFDPMSDGFMSHFDEKGNFIPNRFEPLILEEEVSSLNQPYEIVYHYVNKEDSEE